MTTARAEARAKGLTRYFTGKPCPKGHIAKRMTINGRCVCCLRIATRNNRNGRVRWRQSRRQRQTNYHVAMNLRIRVCAAIRNSQRAGSAVRDLGCTIPEFRSYIAAQFQPGMSWSNWGEWQLDHRRPLASFDLTDRDQFFQACHFTNYQPLWAVDNHTKGCRV